MSAATQTVVVRAAAPTGLPPSDLCAVVHKLGGDETHALAIVGSPKPDEPMVTDRLAVASFEGQPARLVDVEVTLCSSPSTSLYRRVELLPNDTTAHVDLLVEKAGKEYLVTRTAFLPTMGFPWQPATGLLVPVAFGWGALCMIYVALLVWLGRR